MTRKSWVLWSAVLLLWSGSAEGQSVWAVGTSAAAEPVSSITLPDELWLSEPLTPVYDAWKGTKLYDAAPQTVQVTGAETGWDLQILKGERVWFRIATPEGERWVHAADPGFPEGAYQYVMLTGTEYFYSARGGKVRPAGQVSPQLIRVLYHENNDFLVETWLGYQWMHPVHPVIKGIHYDGISSSGRTVQAYTDTPLFASPDAGGEVLGLLGPQQVMTNISLGDEWYYINTWEGPRWVNPRLGYPADLRAEEQVLNLTGSAQVYAHPNKGAKVLGTLAPQPVSVFERGSGWHHIRSSWLGDGWVYQAEPGVDPAHYSAPSQPIPEEVSAARESFRLVLSGQHRNYPLDMKVFVRHGETIAPDVFFAPGEQANIQLSLQNASEDELSLEDSVPFVIDVVRLPGEGSAQPEAVVWSGLLPVKELRLASGEGVNLSFDWNQKDSHGRQVPFGNYSVRIRLPMTFGYTLGGSQEQQEEQAKSAVLTTFLLRIAAP